MAIDIDREDPESIERLEEAFECLTALPEEERPAFLDEACAEDPQMRARLLLWLGSEERRAGFLEDPTIDDDGYSPSADLLLGSMIGPYKVLEQIGEGGYGVVYLAEQREPMTRRVALKVIKLGMDTKQVIARFEAERQALAMMEHPNIAKVLDAGATLSGRPYFVMELVRGVPITAYCDKNQLVTRDRLELFMLVCRAVQHAHQKGIIHRDLKPNNILVTLHDGVPVPKVIDFGIAKATNSRLTDKTLFTQFHQFVGTPAYTSPEQVEMSGLDVDTRSDIYSLGVLLYELLTGTTPIETETLRQAAYAEIQRTILETEPPKPSTRMTDIRKRAVTNATLSISDKAIDQELDWIVMKALEKDRERRYASASAFQQDVQHFLADEPVSAAAPSALYRFRKFARRHTAAVVIGSALLLGGVVSIWLAVKATRANDHAQAQTARAEASELKARKNLYLSDMALAQQRFGEGRLDFVRPLLASHIPTNDDETDLRDFEWRYLWSQTHRELFTVVADDDLNDAIPADQISNLSFSDDGSIMASSSSGVAVRGKGVVRVWDVKTRSPLFQFNIAAKWYSWVDVSPDGNYVAAAGRVRELTEPTPEIVIWDVLRRQEFVRLTIPGAPVEGKPIQPRFLNNHQLCAGDRQGNLWIWDLETKVEARRVPAHEAAVYSIQVSGNRLVTTSGGQPGANDSDRRLRIWDRTSLAPLSEPIELPTEKACHAAISPDGKWVAAYASYAADVWIYSTDDRERVEEIALETVAAGLSFTNDSAALIVLSDAGSMRFYDTADWSLIGQYSTPVSGASALADTVQGRFLAAGNDDGTITVFPGVVPAPITLKSSTEGALVVSIEYSPDNRFLGIGHQDGSVDLWDAKTDELVHHFASDTPGQMVINRSEDHNWRCTGDFLAFSPDGRQLALPSRQRLEKDQTSAVAYTFALDIWDLTSFEKVKSLPHLTWVGGVKWTPDGASLVTVTDLPYDGVKRSSHEGVCLWDVASGQRRDRVGPMGQPIALAMSPDGRHFAWDTQWGTEGVELWSLAPLEEGRPLLYGAESKGGAHAVRYSPDGKWLAVGGPGLALVLWDTASWIPEKTLLGHQSTIADLAFSADGKRLASAGRDNQCRLWDVESGREVAGFPGMAVDLAPDGSAIAVGGEYILNGRPVPEKTTVTIYRAPLLEEIDHEAPYGVR